jgi:hypothetical protein
MTKYHRTIRGRIPSNTSDLYEEERPVVFYIEVTPQDELKPLDSIEQALKTQRATQKRLKKD